MRKRGQSEVFGLTKFQKRLAIALLDRPFGMETVRELDKMLFTYSKYRWKRRMGLIRKSARNREDVFRYLESRDQIVLNEHLRLDEEWRAVLLGRAEEATLDKVELAQMEDATHIYFRKNPAHLHRRPCKVIEVIKREGSVIPDVEVEFYDGERLVCLRSAVRKLPIATQ